MDERKNSGPIFLQAFRKHSESKVRVRGLMILRPGGASALATAHATLPRVWKEAGMEGR
jgi:hypothetical protein